jgi:multisubunit Na+/H+ antiporter MnhC subunit
MDSGDTMFLTAVVVAMSLFAVTLFGVTWLTNNRKK